MPRIPSALALACVRHPRGVPFLPVAVPGFVTGRRAERRDRGLHCGRPGSRLRFRLHSTNHHYWREMVRKDCSPDGDASRNLDTRSHLAYGLSLWRTSVQKARWEPPSSECTSSLHAATLGTMRLALPLAPVIAIGQGEEYAPTYRFDINEQARQFCRSRPPRRLR